MAKQLNINLGFTANISQAQANIQALQQSLNQISSIKPIGGGTLAKDIQIAVNSAKSLEQHLTNAFNVKTGNFDLNKLSLSLRQSGESLNGLSAGLLRAGENGERAFMNVQKALTTANVQINKSNGMLAQFASTLKNTVRWQLSSSLLHGFISGLNQAISYSKDLDKSLNNIRIVTGYSAEDMQKFAKSANEAAKALSSTTNEYTKASLIYFQQGLGSEEVRERTEATIKMANVSGQSAETVSDQMTAVWNNFDDGSKSLEYYADVMVKLGAETASSSDEIAGGLEKFAAVGKTIGLSYEYAAAALATITARTRQSEDVVGTALKTIFARIQGLKLGETLEDGVELNKYSEALQSVGISIFEQNGELKKMDNILNEMGEKWGTLSKAQQVALAQTVAGVRQYTQLVALMDSWNDGQGSFQENLELAKNSAGSLDKQQRTYEESWQAASKRIRASLEGIWEDLIPSDSIIGITDMLTGLLNIIDRLIEGFGGLEGIILLVATIAINKMGPSIANGIDLAITRVQEFKQHLADQNMLSIGGIAQTIKSKFMNMFTPAATSAAQLRENVQAIKYETDSVEKGMALYNQHLRSGASATTQMLQNMNAEAAAQDTLSSSFKQYLADTTQINNLQAMIEANKRKMTQADLDSLSALQSAATAAAERKAIEQETLELIELQIERQKMETDSRLYDSANYQQNDNSSSLMVRQVDPLLANPSAMTGGATGMKFWVEQINQATELGLKIEQLGEGVRLYGDQWYTIGEASATARDMVGEIHSLNLKLNDVISQPYSSIKTQNTELQQRKKIMIDIINKAKDNGSITADVAKRYTGMVNSLNKANNAQKVFRNISNQILGGAKSMAKTLLNSEKNIEKTVNLRNKEHDAQQKVNQATSQHKNLVDQVANGLTKGLSGLSTWGGQISKTISGFSRLAMAANMVKNAIETLNDPDADFTSKLVSSTMALSMGFSALIPVIQGITNGINAYKMAQGGLIATTTAYAAVNKVLATDGAKVVMMDFLKAASSKKLTEAKKQEIITEYAAQLAEKTGISQDAAKVILEDLLIAKSKAKKGATDAETVANWANFASQLAKNWILLLVVAALALIAAATWAVVAAVKADNKAAMENAKAMSELNEKTKELADSTTTLEGEINSLIDTFNQQRAAGEDVSETYTDLVDKLNEVKANYQKLNVSDYTIELLDQAAALGLATGNWEAYTKAQAEAQAQVKAEVGRQAAATTQANLEGAVAAFTEGQGDYEEDSDGKWVRRHVGNAGEDAEVSKILNKAEYAEIFKDITDDDATLRIDWDNESEFMEDYQLLANALRDMEIAGQTSNGTYKELKKEFDAMAEYAGEIEANMSAASEHRFREKMEELGLNAENIDTVDEYTYVLETLTDEMTNFYTSAEEARKQAKAFLGTFGNTTESAAAYNFVEKFGNQMKNAVNYKGVAGTTGTLSMDDNGNAVVTQGTNPTIEVEAKYDEEQIKKEVQAMFDYISGLPEEMRKVAMSIDLENIDSLEEFKTVFEKTQAFEAKVKIQADPQSVMESAKQIRDDLSDAMENFSKQGYLTTTQAIDFLDEFPQYSHYLMETANGYAFTEEAIKEFNGALDDEKKALSELINPTNIGAKELSNFGKELIALEAAVESEGLKKFVTDMQDLTTQFIEGKIKADEYFTSLNDHINNLNFDENTSINDVMAFGKDVVPTMISGIDSYLGAIDAAFEKGQIGAIEYRKALVQSANAILKLEQKTRDAVKTTEEFSGIKFNEQTKQYERSAKWLGKVDQKTKDVVDSMNESLKRSKELEKVLKNMADFEGINVAATEDYDDLQKIFNEDFTIEIDSSQLDDAIAKTQDYRDAIHQAFSSMDEASQKNITQLLADTADKMYAVGTASYTMSAQGQQAFQNLGDKAVQSDNVVYQAAVNMLNGTYDASTESTELTADAMGLILTSGADTSQMVATMTNNVIQGIGDLISNFDATIEIRSAGFSMDWKPYTFDILGKEFTINLPAPHFDIGLKGKLGAESQNTLNGIISNLQGINTITSGKSGGGMSSFAPAQSLGKPEDVKLDEDPDTGGGGGGDKKDKEKAEPKTVEATEKKDLDEEIERYYEINEVLDDLNRELDEIGKKKDEAWGPNKIVQMDKELNKLKQLCAAQEQYGNEIANNLIKDKAAAEAVGAIIDPVTGRITNYDEVMTQLVNTWNDTNANLDAREQNYENAVADASNMEDGEDKTSAEKVNEAEKTEINKARDNANTTYENAKKALEQYTETLNLSEEAQVQLDDYLRQIQQLNYEKLMYKIEFKVELNEMDLKILDFKLGQIEDDFYKVAEAMSFTLDKAEIYGNGEFLNTLTTGITDLKEAYKNGEITQADYIQGLKDIQDNAINAAEALKEMNDQMQAYYQDAMTEGVEMLTKHTEQYDGLLNTLSHYQNVLSIIGKETDYDAINEVLEGRVEVLNDMVTASEAVITYYDSQLAQMRSALTNATSEADKKFWQEQIDEMTAYKQEEQEKLYGYLEEIGETANTILSNSIEKAFKEMEDALTNGIGFEAILEDMERLDTYNDEYLTNTNKMYETNKLISQAQQSLDKTSNLQAKQRYSEYIKYIEQLQLAGNLSKTELEIAQAQYAVLEKKIALEEAQDAKDQVRLTRDAEGNYGYVYTANQDNVASAQQEYLDEQNNLYNIGLEKTDEYRTKIIELNKQTYEELKQLELDYQVNHLYTKEEYERRKAAIEESSQALLTSYTESFNEAQFVMATSSYSALMEEDDLFRQGQLSANKDNYDLMSANDAEYYGGIKGTMDNTQKEMEGLLDTFNTGVLNKQDIQYGNQKIKDEGYYGSLVTLASGTNGKINGIFNTDENSMAKNIERFYGSYNTSLGKCQTASTKWQQDLNPVLKSIGASFDSDGNIQLGDGLKQKVDKVTDASDNLTEELTKDGGLIDSVGETMTKVHEAMLEWQTYYGSIQDVIQGYKDLITETYNLITAQAKLDAAEQKAPEKETTTTTTTDTSNKNSGNTGGTGGTGGSGNAPASEDGGDGVPRVGDVVTFESGKYYYDSYGTSPTGSQMLGKQVKITYLNNNGTKPIHISRIGGGDLGWLTKEQISGYDTGGYTGAWGPEGKLAILHQKEIVLNEEDTQNLLSSVELLREINTMLDTKALIASLGMIDLKAFTVNTEADKVLQQEVTIHADFPNVTDHNEIELAIDNLINAASQYAYK